MLCRFVLIMTQRMFDNFRLVIIMKRRMVDDIRDYSADSKEKDG